ncbi:MAG: type II/IV secretion system protein, partial [Betaproteobacteria bacterium]|nr:type II/IV secretion system protein [Betaproteobacteria bacterium]
MATTQPQVPPSQGGRRLQLPDLLADLVTDGLVPKEVADQLARDRRFARADVHPRTVIADQKWKDPRTPKTALHLEMLTEWLAQKSGLPYFHIDPFKIDFAAVTKVMSSAYADRFKILPVAVTTREATIATAEPYVRDWEESLKQVLRLDIKRVVANPVDIQSYLVEFYNLARSVKGAAGQDKGAYSEIA